MREILNKYWNLLLLDPDLRDPLPSKPAITFRRGRSLRDRLVRSHYVRENNPGTWLDRRPIGSFKCCNCCYCKHISTGKDFTSVATGATYQIREFVNCRSVRVIYQATYLCPLEYVGKTCRGLKKIIVEHLSDIRIEIDTSLSRQMREVHGGQVETLTVRGIEVVKPPLRGGNWDRLMLERESQWIYRLQRTCPEGLNETLTCVLYFTIFLFDGTYT